MRDLKECQAEVFRRSEKRIKQRRKRVLTVCTSLALCAGLSWAFVPGEQAPANPAEYDKESSVLGGVTEYVDASTVCPVAQITVVGDGVSQTHTNPADILQICNQLDLFNIRGQETNGTVMEDGTQATQSSIADSCNSEYSITLVMHQGENIRYSLTGNTLKNLTTNQSHTLSQKQLNRLKEMLGIPHL